MAISWKKDALPPASKLRTGALDKLLEAGYHNPADKRGPIALVTVYLANPVSASAVVDEITRPQRSANPLARAIVDQRLGAAEPGEGSGVLKLFTTDPDRATAALRPLPQVREAKVYNL